MVNKRFLLGMLAMVLVFGMTVVGCEEEDPYSNPIFLDYDYTIRDIPTSLNGEDFTMRLIKNGTIKSSVTGVVVNGRAVANFVCEKMDDKAITPGPLGKEIWVADIAIKIGSNQQLVKKNHQFSKLPDGSRTDALVNGSGSWAYSDFVFE
jgi:hypothetical protein